MNSASNIDFANQIRPDELYFRQMRRMVTIMQDQFRDIRLCRKIQNIYVAPSDRTMPERMAQLLDRLDRATRPCDDAESRT